MTHSVPNRNWSYPTAIKFGVGRIAELADHAPVLDAIRDRARAGPVTLVYGARDTEHNQAVVLRDYLLAHPRRTP